MNKKTKYPLLELRQVGKEFNSSKDILIYLIGLINFMKDNNIVEQKLYNSSVINIFLSTPKLKGQDAINFIEQSCSIPDKKSINKNKKLLNILKKYESRYDY